MERQRSYEESPGPDTRGPEPRNRGPRPVRSGRTLPVPAWSSTAIRPRSTSRECGNGPDLEPPESRPRTLDPEAGLDLSTLTNEMGPIDESDEEREEKEINSPASEHVSIVCACDEFDKPTLSKLLSDMLSQPCKWKYGEQTIFVRVSSHALLALKQRRGRIGSAASSASPLREPLIDKQQTQVPADPAESSDKSIVFFCYGVVVMWGLTYAEERIVLDEIVGHAGVTLRPLEKDLIEKERFSVQFHNSESADIKDDTVYLPRRLKSHDGTRVAMAHVFAQSTKLSVFEEQGLKLLQSTQHLPRELAKHGTFNLSRTALSKMIGKLFVHKSEVSLLSGVFDTPEYFWSAPDCLQDLYKYVGTYLELNGRIETVNNRLDVIQEIFDMLQNRHDAHHGVFLEWIVIILVAIEGLVGILEFCGTIGLIAPVNGETSFADRIQSNYQNPALI